MEDQSEQHDKSVEVCECSEEQVNISDSAYRGVCKWFNNRLGYGFVTVVSDGDKGADVFVHQTNLKPHKSTYRTLSQGEYIQFNIEESNNGKQAINVTGIDSGPLMCDNSVINKENEESDQHGSDHRGSDNKENDGEWQDVQRKKRYPRRNNDSNRRDRHNKDDRND